MMQTPSPEEFMMLAADPDDDSDQAVPDFAQRLAELEARFAALAGAQSDSPSADTYPLAPAAEDMQFASLDAEIGELQQEHTDLEAKHDVVLQLVEQIRGIVKKSTSKVSLDVKAAIDAWANPLGTLTPSPWAQPAHDAPVEEWRGFADGRLKGLGYDLEQMNRSQIRTLLGIEHAAGA